MFEAVEIEINSQCNRKCWYCPNSAHKRIENGEMDSSVFLTLMEQLRNIDFKGRVSFHFYGEPLLCSNLKTFVRTSRSYLPEAHLKLFSNGDFINKKVLVDLINDGVDEFVLTKHVGDSNNFFDKELDKLSIDIRNKIDFREYKDTIVKFSNRGGLIDVGKKNIYQNTPCDRPNNLLVVTLLGNVVPCCEDFYQIDTMGNIMEQSILDIWNSEKYKQYRKNLSDGNRNYSSVCIKCNNENKLWSVEQQKVGGKVHELEKIDTFNYSSGNIFTNILATIINYFVKGRFDFADKSKLEKELDNIDFITVNMENSLEYLSRFGIGVKNIDITDTLIMDIRRAIFESRPILLYSEINNISILFYGINEEGKTFSVIKLIDENIYIDEKMNFSELKALYNKINNNDLLKKEYFLQEYYINYTE